MNHGIGQIPIDLLLGESLALFKVVRHKEQQKPSRLGSSNDEIKFPIIKSTVSAPITLKMMNYSS